MSVNLYITLHYTDCSSCTAVSDIDYSITIRSPKITTHYSAKTYENGLCPKCTAEGRPHNQTPTITKIVDLGVTLTQKTSNDSVIDMCTNLLKELYAYSLGRDDDEYDEAELCSIIERATECSVVKI